MVDRVTTVEAIRGLVAALELIESDRHHDGQPVNASLARSATLEALAAWRERLPLADDAGFAWLAGNDSPGFHVNRALERLDKYLSEKPRP